MLFQQQEQEQAMDTLRVLRMQEAQTYQSILVDLPSSLSPWYYDKKLMDWFKTMTQWCVTVTECCSMPMETVEIALNLLDRYYHSYHSICCRRRRQQQEQDQEQEAKEEEEDHQESSQHFQLATMTCLYIASKTSASRSLTPKQLERLGRNKISVNDIEAMERSILETLKWNINPPTTFAFVKSMLDLVDLDLVDQKQQQEIVWKLVETQTKFATTQLYWLHVPVSKIALASLLNALEWAQIKISLHTRNQLHQAIGISSSSSSTTTKTATTGGLIGQFQQSLASVNTDVWLQQQLQQQQQVPPTKQLQASSCKNNNKTTSTIASIHGESSPTTTLIS
jgi:hypothetical protein